MVISLIFAFHDFVRAFIWSIYTYAVTVIAVKTGLYGVWLEYGSNNLRSASLMRKTADTVNQLKEDVKKARRRKKTEELAAKRQKEAEREAASKSEGAAGLETRVANGVVQTDLQLDTLTAVSEVGSSGREQGNVANSQRRIGFQLPGRVGGQHPGASSMV